MLALLYRYNRLSATCAGTAPVRGARGVENIDASALVHRHGDYPRKIPELLALVDLELQGRAARAYGRAIDEAGYADGGGADGDDDGEPPDGAELAAFEEDGLPELIEVQIPEGLGAGDGFDIDIDGQLLSVEVPEGLVAGDTIAVQRPATCG